MKETEPKNNLLSRKEFLRNIALFGSGGALAFFLASCGTSTEPQPADQYTKNVYPGVTETYESGSDTFRWNSVNTKSLTLGGIAKTSWPSGGGGGDMSKAIYDVNDNGIADKAEAIDDNAGHTASATDITSAVSLKHTPDSDTYLNKGGANEVTAANAADAVSKKHIQNTDTGTSSGSFTCNSVAVILEGDARLINARTPVAHNQAESTITFTDITTGNASTTAHGYEPKTVAPAADALNVVGVANGETTTSMKTVLTTTTPSTQAFGDAASAGANLDAAHSDHKHGMPDFPGCFVELITWNSVDGYTTQGTVTPAGRALRVLSGAVSGNFAGLFSNNNIKKLVDTGKKVTVEWLLSAITSVTSIEIFLCMAQTYAMPVSPTAKHFGFKIINNTLYSTNADGSTEKTNNLGTVSVDAAMFNILRAVYTVGTDIKYYEDEDLLATESSNLPGNGNYSDTASVKTTASGAKDFYMGRILILRYY